MKFKRSVLALIALVAIANIVYWQDPWFWRRYANFFRDVSQEVGLRPFEVVRGDNSLALPVVPEDLRTIGGDALQAAIDYAKEFSSFALLVVRRERLELEWYAEGWNRQRLTESQSMHKTLMGVLVGVAIEEGHIRSVEDPIGLYIDEWQGDPRGEISLRQLLQMSFGLSRGSFSLNPFATDLDWLFSGDSVASLLAKPLAEDWRPGERHEYNDFNAELLGLVIERASGLRYAEYLETRLWRPMGGDRAQVWLDREGGQAHTSCCLATPAIDWARVGVMLLNGGAVNGHRIVPSSWIEEMTTPSPNAYWYGYQTWLGYDDPPFPPGSGSTQPIASEPYRARDTFLTWGRGQQHVWVIPSHELVIVRLGPALGRNPIKPGFDVPRIPNLIIDGMVSPSGEDTAAVSKNSDSPVSAAES